MFRRLRQESRLNGYEARVADEFLKTEIGISRRNDVVRRVAAAGWVSDRGVEDESASASEELDLVSATHRRLALTEPMEPARQSRPQDQNCSNPACGFSGRDWVSSAPHR